MAEALRMYNEANSLDPTNVSVVSNACHMNLLLGNIKQADNLATKCVQLDPTWSKSFYRRATVSIKMQKYTVQSAVHAIQKGLQVDPENADLKKLYAQASKLAEKSNGPSNKEFNKNLMGIMSELQYRSWVTISDYLSFLSLLESQGLVE